MDPGEAFLTALIVGQHEEAGTDENDDYGENDPLDDDASQFSSTSGNNLSGGGKFSVTSNLLRAMIVRQRTLTEPLKIAPTSRIFRICSIEI